MLRLGFLQTSLGYYNVQELFGIDAGDNVHTQPAEDEEISTEGKDEEHADQINTSKIAAHMRCCQLDTMLSTFAHCHRR